MAAKIFAALDDETVKKASTFGCSFCIYHYSCAAQLASIILLSNSFHSKNNYFLKNYSCAARLASIILLSKLFFWENNKIDPKWLKNAQIILPGDAVLSKNNFPVKNYSPEQLLF